MAGVKITDLGTLTTAVNEDLLYIVDVSDTSQSPQGTSKQIEVGNIAAAFGLDSGTYTPTFSAEANLVVTPNSATYIKVGNIVNVSAQLEINLDSGENDGTFEMSLPVASTFTSQKQCFGLMQYSFGNGNLAEILKLSIEANITNNTCYVSLEVLTTAVDMAYCTLTFQYEIL
jgi:hypothetical protein